METVYITHENCVLHRSEDHLILRRQGQCVGTIPLLNVQCIVLISSVQITSQALDMLFEKQIDVIYASRSGHIKGRLQSQSGNGAVVRIAQHHAFVTQDTRLSIAKSIVAGKIANQGHLLETYQRYYALAEYKTLVSKMKKYASKLPQAKSIDEIMGLEGISARVYWDGYRHLLKQPSFDRRAYRPAPDYVNSALNLAYAFLNSELTMCLAAQRFDLEIGFLHSIHYGRNSLPLDLMEEFRSPFADAWLLGLFNKSILKESHFHGQEKGFYLTSDGFAKFIALHHEHLEEGNWRPRFRMQAQNLKKAVMTGELYEPYRCT